jgi:hypothetical protein
MVAANSCSVPISGEGISSTRSWEQSTGELRPTPRGSIPTMSNRLRTSAPKKVGAPKVKSTADPPGPPGLTSRAPIRWAGSVARRRAMVSMIFGP